MANVLSKALIQPQVIPPLHSDQVAEPMMRQLVHNGITKGEHLFIGHSILKQVQVIQGDNTSILHGTPLVLMRKYLIIFGKWIGTPEILLEKGKRLVCHLLNIWT